MESNQNENVMVIDGENEIGLMEWNRKMKCWMIGFKENKIQHKKW
jgi:hypothetical protein